MEAFFHRSYAVKCSIAPDLLEMPLGGRSDWHAQCKKTCAEHALLEAHILRLASGGGRLF